MQVLKTGARRIWDAVRAFFGVLGGRIEMRSLPASQRVTHDIQHQKMLLELASMMEQMHAWTSRMSARDSRAAKQALTKDAPVEPAAPLAPLNQRDRKLALRAYVAARRQGLPGVPPPAAVTTMPPQLQLPEDADGDGPCEECG
jgi:hypothetical protein